VLLIYSTNNGTKVPVRPKSLQKNNHPILTDDHLEFLKILPTRNKNETKKSDNYQA
jgi:hypothetical protein